MRQQKKTYIIDVGKKEIELTKSEINKIIEYYQKNLQTEKYLFSDTEKQMKLFHQYYNNSRTKKSVFIQISFELGIQWKSVEKTYLKYKDIY